jgi:hypothetical protein
MKVNASQENLLKYFSVLLIGLGLIFNEFVIVPLISPDGIVELQKIYFIRILNFSCISFGLLILLSNSTKAFIIQTGIIQNTVDNYVVFIRSLLMIIISLVLVMQISSMVSAIYKNHDNHGISYSIYADAGTDINFTKTTTWIEGGSYLHGTLYFRIAHFLTKLSPSFEIKDSFDEKYEKKIHFSLQIISLISIYLLSFLLANIIIKDSLYKLFATLLISSSIFTDDVWVSFIFKAHPDMLLTFLSALFIFLIYRWKIENNSYYFFLVCLVGGACLSTKLIFIFFLPGLFFIEAPPVTKNNLKTLIKLYLGIAFSYLILALPNSINILYVIKRMKYQSITFSIPPTLNSFLEWWTLFLNQAWLVIVLLVLLYLFLGDNNKLKRGTNYLYLRLCIISFVPFILLLTRNVISPHNYYTLPFVSAMLVTVAVCLTSLRGQYVYQIKNVFIKDLTKIALIILMLISVDIPILSIPDNVNKVLNRMTFGRSESRETYQLINSYAEDGKIVLVEAQIPYKHGLNNLINGGHLTMTLERFKIYEPDILALNKNELPYIMDGDKPNDYYIATIRDNYLDIRKYYELFYGKNITVDPWGREWIKIYEDIKGVQLWEKQLKLTK